MGDRLKYLEDSGKPPLLRQPEPPVEDVRWPILARYDFAGNGPRPGERHDNRLYDQARMFQTLGEQLAPTVTRIAWILLRLAIGLAIIYLFLRGNTFDCIGHSVIFN